jgi:RNA-directed DNA polymerase
MQIAESYIPDKDIVALIAEIIESFHSTEKGIGLPLGNLTSQLFVNIYMNEFDQFMKHKIKAKYYIRYADDFVILSEDKEWLKSVVVSIQDFLTQKLHLSLHPKKVSISTIALGVDFLGWILFPDHRVVRTVTKRRMFRGIREKEGRPETVQSYLGLIRHGNTEKLRGEIEDYVI